MPKLIDNVRGRAIEEARRVLIEEGYAALTIRGIAQKLGIGLGTIYNYFPSKEYLAAGVMLEDWQELTKEFESAHAGAAAETVIEDLFRMVHTFTLCYSPAWREYEQHGSTRSMISRYHSILIGQLAEYIRTALPAEIQEQEPWLTDFLAETVLRFGTDAGFSYEKIAPAIRKLWKEI